MGGYFYHQYNLGPFAWLAPFVVIEIILKGIALWKAARNKQLYWFIALIVVNSVGVLPLIYLLFFQRKRPQK